MCEMSWPRTLTKCCVGPFGILHTIPAGYSSEAWTFLTKLENQLENCGGWDAGGWAGLGHNYPPLSSPGGQEPYMGGL